MSNESWDNICRTCFKPAFKVIRSRKLHYSYKAPWGLEHLIGQRTGAHYRWTATHDDGTKHYWVQYEKLTISQFFKLVD